MHIDVPEYYVCYPFDLKLSVERCTFYAVKFNVCVRLDQSVIKMQSKFQHSLIILLHTVTMDELCI